MSPSTGTFWHFCLCALCLVYHLTALSTESEKLIPSYLCSKEGPKDEPTVFMPDQRAALTSDVHQLIAGLISPLSGNPSLRQTDFTVVGAQKITLDRIYIAPYMPYTFHKHGDADCYYRRDYLNRHYEGWKLFPHVRLWLDPSKNEIHLITPNGARYDFSLSNSKTTLLHPYAVSNVGEDEIPSGQFDPRNTHISYENGCVTVFSSNASTRYYCYRRGSLFLLDKEVLPNGKVLKYHYTEAGNLSLIESLDPQERYVYASINIEGSRRKATSSTGLETSYRFERKPYHGKFREGKLKMEYSGATPRLLVATSSPEYREEIAEYSDPDCLLRSFSGKKTTFKLNYTSFGKGDRRHFRVDQIQLPVGEDDTFIPLYQLTYQPAVAGEKEGETTVKNSDGTSIVYHFSKNLLTTSIQYFAQKGHLKKEKFFSWNDNNRLATVELRDDKKNLFHRKTYEYDSFGNPILETITGDLQGRGQEDSYCIKRAFSQDGRHLLLREETEEGKVITFDYLPNTNLITLKLLKEGDRILTRECFQYDDCHNLIQKGIDDNSSQKRWIDYRLRQEEPFLHMPEWVEEKCLDEGEERLLKCTHLIYDPHGNVGEEKVYDASGAYAYSIFREYNERGDLLSETNPMGQRETFAYDGKGRRLEATHFSQKLKKEMSYDTKGRLRDYRAIGEDGTLHTATYEYDINDNLTQKTDTYNNVFSYSYDPSPIKSQEPTLLPL